MMGQQKSDPELFNYAINLEKRVRSTHPLRKVKVAIDFGFVREAVAHCYGKNGNESVAPEVILKMMFLLFFDDIKSERELMEVIGERLDYLWFLDYGLDEKIPDHSVLSKARARWGKEVFESLFVRTVAGCVEAGLIDGSKLHVDASLVDADAAKESVIKGAPQLIAALKRAYQATESKLEESSTPESYRAVNDRMVSQSDPDAALVRKGGGDSRVRYQNHRVIDDAKGVITAIETTPGSIAENKKLMDLIDQRRTRGHGEEYQPHTQSDGATVNFSPQLSKMALQPFDPDPHTVYTIETAAHFSQMSRRMVLVCCKHGLISPTAGLREHGYCFTGNAVRTLRRIQDLRTVGGINLAGIKIILNLSNKVEELRSILMHNGSANP